MFVVFSTSLHCPGLFEMRMCMKDAPGTIDEYLSALGPDKRDALEKLRQVIREIVPEAEECIRYGIPTFRLDGKTLVAIGAAAHHCALYPMSASIVETFQDELKDFSTSKGTIRFQPETPLTKKLVQKLIEARIRENQGKRNKGKLTDLT